VAEDYMNGRRTKCESDAVHADARSDAMTSDRKVRRLRALLREGQSLRQAASRVGIDVKTARKYQRSDSLPSQTRTRHSWRTREDPFHDVWPELEAMLWLDSALGGKAMFLELQSRFPGRFADGQLRTLQRRIRRWCTGEGKPAADSFFDRPGCSGGEPLRMQGDGRRTYS
jgi:hypothetical protein